jgi:UDP-N-acetylmuramoyl-L-alanyl-D-glutamate--2,6-diaminopimelate ligase
LGPRGRLIAVFGSAGQRDHDKRPKMGKVAGDLADVVILTDDDPRDEDPLEIAEQIKSGMKRSKATIKIISPRSKAIEQALKMARAGDLVMLLGKVHEKTLIYDKTIDWDEAKFATNWLKKIVKRPKK